MDRTEQIISLLERVREEFPKAQFKRCNGNSEIGVTTVEFVDSLDDAGLLITVDMHHRIPSDQWRVALTTIGAGSDSLKEAKQRLANAGEQFAKGVSFDRLMGGDHG